MSYRNPQQVVDTQSGQYVRDMMKNVTSTAVDLIQTRQKELKETQKRNVEMQTKVIQAQARIANSANAEDVKNSGTDWATAIRKGIDEYGELYAKSLKDPLKFTSEDALRMSSLANMGTQIKQQAVEDQADMEEWTSMIQSGAGQYGGYDMYGNSKIYERLNIQGQVGATPGKSIGVFDWNPESGGLTTKVISYDGEGSEIGTNANRGAELPVIANPTKNMQEVAAAISLTKKDYYKDQTSTPDYDPVTKKTEYYRNVNMDQLIADVRSQSDGYIVGLGTQGAIRLGNNTMLDEMDDPAKGQGFIKGDLAKIMDPDKVVWQMNENGKVNDPQLERIQIAYAKKIIEDRGLAPRKPVDTVRDPKPNVEKPRFIQFQDAIKEGVTGSTIRKSATERWELQGKEKVDNKYNPDRQYVLPAIKDPTSPSKNRKAETVNYYKTRNGKVVLNSNGTPMINYPGINSTLGLTSSK